MKTHSMMSRAAGALATLTLAGLTTMGLAQAPAPASASAPAQVYHFHHVHLNTVNAKAAVGFYATHFNAEQATFAGQPAVRAQGKWLLFNEVKVPPAWPVVSSLYHIGWGAPDVKTTYQRLKDKGVPFATPLTDISQVIEADSGRTFFAYVDGPDHAIIEINSASDDSFQHVHFLSDDPVSAGQWYMKHFGAVSANPNPSREARMHNGLQIYPYIGAKLDGVQFWWYPRAFGQGSYPDAWKGRTAFASPRGRVIDHIAFSVANLDGALARLEADGVKILQRPKPVLGGLRSAFVAAPDGVELELVETAPATAH